MTTLVVGAGSIGRRHLRNLAALGCGSLAVCDPDPAALVAARAIADVAAFPDLGRALATGPALVLVCTPTNLHVATARAAVEAGADVFVEKPVALSLDGLDDLARLAAARRRKVFVGCNMRFHPGPAHLKAAVDDGALGPVVQVYARFSHLLSSWRPGVDYRTTYSARRAEGGGALLEGVHEIDYLRWIVGEIADVTGWVGRQGTLDIDVEDTAFLALRFASGAAGRIHLDLLSPVKLRGAEIVGPDAAVRWTSEGKAPEAIRVEFVRRDGGRRELFRAERWDADAMYVEELRHLRAAVDGAATPLLDLDGARRVLEIALAAREAGGNGWRALEPAAATAGGPR